MWSDWEVLAFTALVILAAATIIDICLKVAFDRRGHCCMMIDDHEDWIECGECHNRIPRGYYERMYLDNQEYAVWNVLKDPKFCPECGCKVDEVR